MSKNASGITLVSGLIVSMISGAFVAIGSTTPSQPGMDFQYDLIKYAGIAGVLIGIGMFFFGAKSFASK